MSLSVGIVGLPNVGKSTIFNALTKSKVETANYAFCTIDPHSGCISVPDIRLDQLSETNKSEKIVPAIVDFVDIAGLVKGAHKGEGLGNQFLSTIRECDAIVHILRHFKSGEILHVENRIDPKDDLEIIEYELIYSDLQQIEKGLDKIGKAIKNPKIDKETKLLHQALTKCNEALKNNILLKHIELLPEELEIIKTYGFLTQKPALYVLNITEEDIKKNISELLADYGLDLKPEEVIPICAKLEEELIDLSEEEVKEYLKELGAEYTGLEQLIIAGYKKLNLISMFTSGEKETRAWTITNSLKAPQAAGKIHTDFEKGFIKAEVINWQDLIEQQGWVKAREKGLVRQEGKEYVVKEGDTVIFKFNV